MDKSGSIKRIPIREVFIKVKTIIDAFANTQTLTAALQEILDEIRLDE